MSLFEEKPGQSNKIFCKQDHTYDNKLFLLLMLFATVKPYSYNHPRFMKGFFLIFGLKQFGRSSSCLGSIVKPSTDGTSHTDKYKNIHLGSK